MGGLFGRANGAPRVGRANGAQSYEDVEQLLMQVGIISAFMFSISLSTQSLVLPGRMDQADFFSMLCFSQQFRSYLVDRLEASNFAGWQIPYDINATLDVKDELQVNVRCHVDEVLSTPHRCSPSSG